MDSLQGKAPIHILIKTSIAVRHLAPGRDPIQGRLNLLLLLPQLACFANPIIMGPKIRGEAGEPAVGDLTGAPSGEVQEAHRSKRFDEAEATK